MFLWSDEWQAHKRQLWTLGGSQSLTKESTGKRRCFTSLLDMFDESLIGNTCNAQGVFNQKLARCHCHIPLAEIWSTGTWCYSPLILSSKHKTGFASAQKRAQTSKALGTSQDTTNSSSSGDLRGRGRVQSACSCSGSGSASDLSAAEVTALGSSEYTTTSPTPFPGYVLPTRKLDQSCGDANKTWGYCYPENSACTYKKNSWGQDERKCQCIHNTFMVEDETNNYTCAEVPNQLLRHTINLTLQSDVPDSRSVYSSSLDFRGVEMNSVDITYSLYPANSFLYVPPTGVNFSIQTSGKLPDVDAVYLFFLRVDVHDTMNDWLSSDITTLNVTVRRVFPRAVPVADVFLLDGSRRGTIVYDVTSALGNVDNTDLRLLPESGIALFQLQSKRRIVCVSDVNINNFRTSPNAVGHVMTLNLTSSGQVVLTLKVAVIVGSVGITVRENNGPGWNLVTFSSLLERFDVTGENFPADLPLRLSLTDSAVQLTRGLDFETGPQIFSVTITVRSRNDSLLSTSITTTVSVTDQNDSPPVFRDKEYFFAAPYGSDRGSLVGRLTVDDQDSLPQTFTFQILPSRNSSLFQIPDSIGLIEVTKKLPEDAGPDGIVIQVSVSDGVQNSTQPTTVRIYISSAKQDFEVVGGMHYVTVVENTAVGTPIFNASLTNYTGYQLVDLLAQRFFVVNQTTGIVSIRNLIDREGKLPPENFIVVGYQEEEVCKLKIVNNISMTIEDVNDNAPVFQSLNYSSIQENSAAGTSVVKFYATDPDYLYNATLTYNISGGNSSLFKIDSATGLLTVSNSSGLDREVLDAVRFTVTVTDGGTTLPVQYRLSATMNFTVILLDVNDNSPGFNQSVYSVNVLENITVGLDVAVVKATDRDVDLNGEIRYSIGEGAYGFFSISATTGVLRTKLSLDRETREFYSITVMASDLGSPPRSSSATVLITVLDVNDNSPQFQSQIYLPPVIDEGTSCTNSSFVTVKAEDKDFGINSDIVYSIDSDLLNINPATGQVTCKSSGLDYENVTQRSFDVRVRATDKGTPPLNGTSIIRVTVRDVNDNSPTFFNSPYNISVRIETFDTSSPIFVFSVDDRDSGENREMDFKLIDTRQGDPYLFAVDNAVLRVNRTGRPQLPVYFYTVVATDKGRPPLTGSASVEIHINDAGSSVVSFGNQKNAFFQVVEETPYYRSLGKAIGQLKATVQGQSSALVYSLVTNNSFEVNSATGELFCSRVWDRERDKDSSEFLMLAAATSRNDLDYALVQVKLLDINDNAPTILTPQSALIVSVGEDAGNGTFVVSLSASDPDEGENGTVIFAVEREQAFSIETQNSAGKILVNGILDREQRSEYTIIVTVRDNATTPETRKSTSTSVIIDIKDVNDNFPIFVGVAPISVPENTNVSTPVGYVNATDTDNGVNATLTYSVINETTCPLRIIDEPESSSENGNMVGHLFLQRPLDYERQTNYTCLIQAADVGPAPLSSTATVTIYVTDVNDNAPVIHNDSFSVNVSRDVSVGYVLVDSLNATDADSGSNGVIVFFLDPSDGAYGYFTINPRTGAVSVQSPLGDFQDDVATLNVSARDSPVDTPRLVSNILQIQVNISHDSSRPQFDILPDNLNITEGQLQSSLVTATAFVYVNRVKVNCNCSYAIDRIVPGYGNSSLLQNTFKLDSTSGEITLIKPLDREATGNNIRLILLASDYGTPRKTGTATLTISVLDVNDESPTFNMNFLELNVTESLCSTGHFLYNLTAHDADAPPNNVVVYSLRQLYPEQQLVTIDNSSGQLSLPCSVQNDTKIIATVKASDYLDTGKLSSVDLIINAIAKDPNPHAPFFINQDGVYRSVIPYTAAMGYPLSIVNFNATDPDPSQSIIYSVVNGNVRDLFAFDSSTLLFTLKYEIDKTIPPVLNITVKATDYGNFSSFYRKTTTATIMVTISGESTPCYNASDVAALSGQAEKFKLYQGLFIAIVILLAIAILLCVIFVYKWRASVSEANTTQSSDNTANTHPLMESSNTITTNLSPTRSAAGTSGFPPELPRRAGGVPQRGGQNTSGESGFVSMPHSSDPSWDSNGYLRPSERGDSDRQYSWDDEGHESLEPGETSGQSTGYTPVMDEQPPRHRFHKPGSAGFGDVVSPQDVYIHPIPDHQGHGTYLQTTRKPQAPREEPSATYLRAIPGPTPGYDDHGNSRGRTNADRDAPDGRRTHEIPRAALVRPSPSGFLNRAPEPQLSSSRPGFAVRFPEQVQPQAMPSPVSRTREDITGSPH